MMTCFARACVATDQAQTVHYVMVPASPNCVGMILFGLVLIFVCLVADWLFDEANSHRR